MIFKKNVFIIEKVNICLNVMLLFMGAFSQ